MCTGILVSVDLVSEYDVMPPTKGLGCAVHERTSRTSRTSVM